MLLNPHRLQDIADSNSICGQVRMPACNAATGPRTSSCICRHCSDLLLLQVLNKAASTLRLQDCPCLLALLQLFRLPYSVTQQKRTHRVSGSAVTSAWGDLTK
eukprot:GHRQ01021990.1.p2 GENE.GHRQ01021990.1~~GHRQ01021990.1.p2  ORF type:complete len:103 (+),score=8.00 GHRQ01021990.1:759-1067(+)